MSVKKILLNPCKKGLHDVCSLYHFQTPITMKKNYSLRFTALAAGIFSACFAFGSEQNGKANSIQLLSSTENESVIKFTMNDYGFGKVTTPWGEQNVVNAKNTTPILKKGAPNLPKFAASVMIPDNAKMDVQIVSSSYIDYPNMEIAPSKGTLSRAINPSDVPYEKGTEYSSNSFFPSQLASLREPYIVRDFRGQTVLVNPFQYNPVTKILRVYSEITVKVFQSGSNGSNSISRAVLPQTIDKEFSYVYQNLFLNCKNGNPNPNYAPVAEYGNMLIICYNSFMSAMQPFVDWKVKMGIPVTMVDVTTAGSTAAAIQSYVQNFYNTNGLSFLLLVGDAPQVPSTTLPTGDSDVGYGYIVGSDRYPDILVGRFSAATTAQVTTMVDRCLRYEKFPQPNLPFYKHGIGIGSDQGPGDDNQYDYQQIRSIRSQLMAYTYSSVDEIYDGSQGGMDASGNPTSSTVAAALTNGASIINYCGHGFQTGWGTSGFSNSGVDALNNTDSYPFIFSVACVNGDFVNGTCFAEAWLRATDNNGAPAGAIATIMSTINQNWNEPMEGEDEMDTILCEAYANNIKRTFGGITMNGCMKMNDAYGSSGMDMTDTWTIFGDPSVMVRTDVPVPMTVSHVATEYVGVTQLVVNCNTNGALVGLSIGGTRLGSGFVNNGSVTITFPAVPNPCTIDVYVTAYNKIPYMGTVQVMVTGIESPSGNISTMSLYPNPAISYSVLSYTITSPENASVKLYNALGKEVMNIADEKITAPGTYSAKINTTSLEKGIYFCTVKTGESTMTKKLVVTK